MPPGRHPVATPTIATESDYTEWLAERDRGIASYTRPPNDRDPPPTPVPPPVTSPLGAALARHREGGLHPATSNQTKRLTESLVFICIVVKSCRLLNPPVVMASVAKVIERVEADQDLFVGSTPLNRLPLKFLPY